MNEPNLECTADFNLALNQMKVVEDPGQLDQLAANLQRSIHEDTLARLVNEDLRHLYNYDNLSLDEFRTAIKLLVTHCMLSDELAKFVKVPGLGDYQNQRGYLKVLSKFLLDYGITLDAISTSQAGPASFRFQLTHNAISDYVKVFVPFTEGISLQIWANGYQIDR